MRIVVDLNRCLGYAQCVPLAPEVLKLSGEEALTYDPNPDDSQRQRVLGRGVVPGAGDHRGRARPTGVVVTVSIKDNGRIVIVGASLAGLRAAEALREEGFRGRLTVIGDEPGEPYDRPPLSKQVLAGWVGADGTKPPRMREVDAEWRLGVAATALDRANRFVRLADGSEVEGRSAADRHRGAVAEMAQPALRQHPTGYGWPTSPMYPRGRGSPMSPSSSTPMHAGSWAGGWRPRWPPRWSSMPSNKPSGPASKKELST